MNVSKTLVLALILSTCASAVAADFGAYDSAQVNTVYQTLNRFRQELGLRPLRQDARLNTAAQKHADWMQGIGYLTHVGPTLTGSSYTRAMAEGVPTDATIGENIASGNFEGRATFLQWLYSPAHLGAMIEPDYDHVGIARSDCDAESGGCYWVMDFSQFEDRAESERVFTNEEVARAAETVLGPLGADRAEISVESSERSSGTPTGGATAPEGTLSPWQAIKNRVRDRVRERWLPRE